MFFGRQAWIWRSTSRCCPEDFAPDELTLYALSKIANIPVNILLSNKSIWTPNAQEEDRIDLHCGVTFVYVGDRDFALTRTMDCAELKE